MEKDTLMCKVGRLNIIAVDDEHLAVLALEQAIQEAAPEASVTCFLSAADALAYAAKETVDIAFLDIEMGSMDGLTLAKKLKDSNGQTNIIFVTGHLQYAKDAFLVRASGYLRKPVTAEDILAELKDLRHPPEAKPADIRVQCFGNFEFFVQGRPVHFHRSKSKEILAYLVSKKGASVTKKELAAVLWEDADYNRATQSYLQALVAEMMRALQSVGAAHLVIRRWNSMALDVSAVECDYFNFVRGDAEAVNAYRGEFMANYPWAEFIVGWLDEVQRKR